MFRGSEGALLAMARRQGLWLTHPKMALGRHFGLKCVVRSLGFVLKEEEGNRQICLCYSGAVTKYHKLGGLKTDVLSHSSES